MSKIGLLRSLVANLVSFPMPDGVWDEDWLDSLPITVGEIVDFDRVIGIKSEAAEPLDDLTKALYECSPAYQRGFPFGRIRLAILDAIVGLHGRPAESIGQDEVSSVEGHIAGWFSTSTRSQRLFIPCHIFPDHEPPFAIGPVFFAHWQDFVNQHDWIEREGKLDPQFGQALTNMDHESAYYFADVTVEGCSNERARELAELAVDDALVGLQLIIKHPGVCHIARMTARRAPLHDASIELDGDSISYNLEPRQWGVRLHEGELNELLKKHARLVTAVGNRVSSFLTGSSPLPQLDQAWCDSAYWFHEGLAEPLDTMAVPMLETAIEVLFRSVSTSGTEQRLLNAITTFYGRQPDEFIHANSRITVKRLAKDLVRDRSRILHGTWPTLTTYLHESRPSLTEMARFFLTNFAVGMDDYSRDPEARDTIESFFVWVDAWRSRAGKE